MLIREIRCALGEDARHGTSVRTVQRFGYAFAGCVAVVPRSRPDSTKPPICAIEWQRERSALPAGEHIVGRDPAAHVRIEAVGVSRRHAALLVAEDAVTLTDLSSKNGTFVDDVRVHAPIVLGRNAEIRLGPEPIRFRRWSDVESTATWNDSPGTGRRSCGPAPSGTLYFGHEPMARTMAIAPGTRLGRYDIRA